MKVFNDKPLQEEAVMASEQEHSLSFCIQRWLERTPGLQEEGFNFPHKFKTAVETIFEREYKRIQVDNH